MSYVIVQIAAAGEYLDGRRRLKPLPAGVQVQLRKQIGNEGHRKNGDHYVEFCYDSRKAEIAHLRQRQGI
jgi:hypothetical protein